MKTASLRKIAEGNGFELVLDSQGYSITSLATGLVARGDTPEKCYSEFLRYRTSITAPSAIVLIDGLEGLAQLG